MLVHIAFHSPSFTHIVLYEKYDNRTNVFIKLFHLLIYHVIIAEFSSERIQPHY